MRKLLLLSRDLGKQRNLYRTIRLQVQKRFTDFASPTLATNMTASSPRNPETNTSFPSRKGSTSETLGLLEIPRRPPSPRSRKSWDPLIMNIFYDDQRLPDSGWFHHEWIGIAIINLRVVKRTSQLYSFDSFTIPQKGKVNYKLTKNRRPGR